MMAKQSWLSCNHLCQGDWQKCAGTHCLQHFVHQINKWNESLTQNLDHSPPQVMAELHYLRFCLDTAKDTLTWGAGEEYVKSDRTPNVNFYEIFLIFL